MAGLRLLLPWIRYGGCARLAVAFGCVLLLVEELLVPAGPCCHLLLENTGLGAGQSQCRLLALNVATRVLSAL